MLACQTYAKLYLCQTYSKLYAQLMPNYAKHMPNLCLMINAHHAKLMPNNFASYIVTYHTVQYKVG